MEFAGQIRMIRQIAGGQENKIVLINGHFAGTRFQSNFCIRLRTGTEGQKEQHQDEQQRFPHGITVFLRK